MLQRHQLARRKQIKVVFLLKHRGIGGTDTIGEDEMRVNNGLLYSFLRDTHTNQMY